MYLGVREPLGNRGELAAPHDNLSPFNPVFAQLGLPLFPNAYTNISRFPMTAVVSLAFAGGGLVSNIADLAEWGSALFSGRATSQPTLNQMINSIYATPDANGNFLGYGIKVIPHISPTEKFLGHNGDAPGYRSVLVHAPERKITLAVLSNFGGADPYAIARALYQALAPAITAITPQSGVPGSMVTINGEGLSTTTSVLFNGVTASFTINNENQITAEVPASATSGQITLITAGGTVRSSESFTVINNPSSCNLTLTTKVTQAEPWYGMWGAFNGAGAIDLTVMGGTAPYTYRWNAGVSTQDLSLASPGYYSVTVTDANGCTAMTTAYVGRKNDFLRVLSSHQNVSNARSSNGAIDLTVIGGGEPATFMWSNGATTEDLAGLSAGTYKVIVTDAFGRKATTTVVISEPGTPLSLSIAHQNVSATGRRDGAVDLTVIGGMAPYTYRWNTGATTEDLHFATPGDYSVTVTDADGATATAMVRVEVGRTPIVMARKPITGDDLFTASTIGLNAYPNPATDKATVSFKLQEAGNYSLDLYDIRGAKVKTLSAGKAEANQMINLDLEVANYAKGVYLLKLITDKGNSSKRLMIGR